MTLNRLNLPVPDGHEAGGFVLRRQRLEDNRADFDAVMASRAALRLWSDSAWPEETFTLDDNGADLAMHIGEHERNEAYGFSIVDSSGQLAGSLYLNALDAIIGNYRVPPELAPRLAALDVCADYWLREGTSDAMEVDLIGEVKHWLDSAWWFGGVAFGSRRHMSAQRSRYERAGLKQIAALRAKEGPRRFFLHA